MNDANHARSTNGPKACTTCAKAKSRCNPGPTEAICERCHRLNKLCSAQTPAPPRKRKAPKPTRVAELEKRLEDLTARVESRQQPRSLTPTSGDLTVESEEPPRKVSRSAFPDFRVSRDRPGYSHIFAPDDSSYHDQHREQALRHQRQTSRQSNDSYTCGENLATGRAVAGSIAGENDVPPRTSAPPQHSQPSAISNLSSSLSASGASLSVESQHQQSSGRHGPGEIKDPWYYPSSEEAQEFLGDFSTHLVPLFPFVVIPSSVTSQALRRDRPLLWKAVMTQGLHMHARRQVSMGDELLGEIVATAYLQTRKSLDLLQALEVLLAWFYMSTKSFQLTNLLFLLRSLCVSLGFNESQEFSKEQERTVASLEQMRAFTGVYYLVTMVFTTNKKPDAFMNTTYLDHCCRVLEQRMEHPTDQLVVLLVRTQQISQSISMTLAFRKNRDSLPLSLIIQSFQHEIRQLRNTIPDDLRESAALKPQIHIAEILLYESGLSEELSADIPPTDRLELLWDCLNAIKAMLNARFKKKSDGWPRAIVLGSFDYTFAMLVCLKLSLLQLPGWDLRLVRKELSFDEYLDMQIVDLQRFTSLRDKSQTVEAGGGPTKVPPESAAFEDPFVHLHTRLSKLRVCIAAELCASLPPDPQHPKMTDESSQNAVLVDGAVAATGPSTATAFGDTTFSAVTMPGLDDPFWQDLYKSNEWETNFNTLLGWGSDDANVPTYANWNSDVPSYGY